MRGVILTKDSGNLLEEGLIITKKMLEECLERGIFIDARTGEYSPHLKPGNKGSARLKCDIIIPLHELYVSGEMSLKTSTKAFINNPESITNALKRKGFKMLSKRESFNLYKDEIRNKHQQTCLELYGVPYVLTITASNVPQNEAVLRWTAVNNNPSYETILESSYSPGMHHYLLRKHKVEGAGKIKTELKLRHLLKALDCKFYKNARKLHSVHNPKGRYYELDAYIPELKLGIEINGLSFHSVNKAAHGEPKTPEWHFEKFKAFRNRGILMISFTDYEQEHFKSDYENIIKYHLLGEPLNVSRVFLEFNQISSIEESLNYGLFDPNQFTGNFEDHQHQRFIEDYEYWDCGKLN